MRKPVKKMSAKDLKEKLRGTFKSVDFLDKESNDELYLEFATDKNKDYLFYVWIESSWTTTNIGARLKNDPDGYFWYDSIETSEIVDDSWREWTTEFIVDRISKLTNFETRIIQIDGLLFSWFKCEYFDNTWKSIHRHSGYRWTLSIPKIKGWKKIYQ